MSAPTPTDAGSRAARRTRLFGIALVATVVVSALPLPWRLSGLGFGTLALYAGTRLLLDLAAQRRAGRPSSSWLGVAMGIALSTFMMLLLVGQLALYPLFAEQERCNDLSITHLDAEQCRVSFEQQRDDLLHRVSGGR